MTTFARIVSGRRSKFVVLARLARRARRARPAHRRSSSRSSRTSRRASCPTTPSRCGRSSCSDQFPSAEGVAAIAVFSREGGLTAADRQAIADVRAELDASPPEGVVSVSPPRLSEDGEAALVVAQIVAEGDEEVLIEAVELDPRDGRRRRAGRASRRRSPDRRATRPTRARRSRASTRRSSSPPSMLVFVLLVIIYRSPIFWILPLLSVFFAEALVRGIGSLLVDAGVVVNGQTGGILLVLVFGAGTDYALLLTARYREELHRHEDKHEAMRIAVRQAGPGILASAGTVVAALLCLSLASVNSTAGLGPVGAMGVAVAATGDAHGAARAAPHRRPACVLAVRARASTTRRPSENGTAWRRGFWGRLGPWIERRHRAGLDRHDPRAPRARARDADARLEPDDRERVPRRGRVGRGSEPARALVPGRRERADDGDRHRPGAGSTPCSPAAERRSRRWSRSAASRPASPARCFAVTLTRGSVRRGRASRRSSRCASSCGPRVATPCSSAAPTAEEHDLREAVRADTLFLVPLVLLVVFAILVLLLRAIARPADAHGDGRALVLRRARAEPRRLRALRRLPGRGSELPALRVHLPRRAGDRLQHLPHGARARGGAADARRTRRC